MFWSGNYIAVRELNNLLKEESVTLTQVLETDDILQECKADNKALISFLTRSEILAELVTLITEEPPNNVDMASQYRHAHIASEVLTSQLMMFNDRLSMDAVQMNRLCDFVNKDPPLNPLLASYFAKTIEMLLEKSPKQDWYLYHIVGLRVLDFFRSRRDFLPNLLRHISTSTIADIFKYFIRLDDPFNKIILEWLEEHQFLESLIHIVCGTYEYEEIRNPIANTVERSPEHLEKGQQETSEKVEMNHKAEEEKGGTEEDSRRGCKKRNAPGSAEAGRASANATALLCDLVAGECAPESNTNTKSATTSFKLLSQLRSEEMVHLLLQSMFTSPPAARRSAVINGSQLLVALVRHVLNSRINDTDDNIGDVEWAIAPHLPLLHQALLRPPQRMRSYHEDCTKGSREEPQARNVKEEIHIHKDEKVDDGPLLPKADAVQTDANSEGTETDKCNDNGSIDNGDMATHNEIVPNKEIVTADNEQVNADTEEPTGEPIKAKSTPTDAETARNGEQVEPDPKKMQQDREVDVRSVGVVRVHMAALIAQLAASCLEEIQNALLTLGTPGVLIDMFFEYPQNNFLHTQVYLMIHNALSNGFYAESYTNHLIEECNLLTRLMDTYEENENTKAGAVRRGNMGHVVQALRRLDAAKLTLSGETNARWLAFRDTKLRPLLQRHDTTLGGYYALDNINEGGFYASENIYEYNETMAVDESVGAVDLASNDASVSNENHFLEIAIQRYYDMWDGEADGGREGDVETENEREGEVDAERVREILADGSPWESAGEGSTSGADWANFGDAFRTAQSDNAIGQRDMDDDFRIPQGDNAIAQYNLEQYIRKVHPVELPDADFSPFWHIEEQNKEVPDSSENTGVEQGMQSLQLKEATVKPTAEPSAELTEDLTARTPEAVADLQPELPRSPPTTPAN